MECLELKVQNSKNMVLFVLYGAIRQHPIRGFKTTPKMIGYINHLICSSLFGRQARLWMYNVMYAGLNKVWTLHHCSFGTNLDLGVAGEDNLRRFSSVARVAKRRYQFCASKASSLLNFYTSLTALTGISALLKAGAPESKAYNICNAKETERSIYDIANS